MASVDKGSRACQMKTFSSPLGMVIIFKRVSFSYQKKFTLDQLIHRPFGINEALLYNQL